MKCKHCGKKLENCGKKLERCGWHCNCWVCDRSIHCPDGKLHEPKAK